MSRHLNIAIYHNLDSGGAKTLLNKLSMTLKAEGHYLTLFANTQPSVQEKKIYRNIYYETVRGYKNTFDFYLNHVPDLWKKSMKLAAKINKGNYDIIILNHCRSMQTPLLILWLSKTSLIKSIYIFHELKREFYEKVSYDHYSIKRRMARLCRYFIKWLEIYNLKKLPNIISNSHYSRCNLYRKTKITSYCISPYQHILHVPKIQHKVNKHSKYFTSGGSSYIKGYYITKQVSKLSNKKIVIYCQDDKTVAGTSNQVSFVKNKNLNRLFKDKQSSIYMAHGINEPLGLMTLNALNHKILVYALNLGANSELIKTGINGYLYPVDIKIINNVLSKNYHAPTDTLTTQFKWKYYTNTLLKIVSFKHESAY